MTHEEAMATAAFYAARIGAITEPIQMHGGEWAVKVVPHKRTAKGEYVLDWDGAYLVRIPKTS